MMKRPIGLLLIMLVGWLTSVGDGRAQSTRTSLGPKPGETIPSFQARDQFGHIQTLTSLAGPQGLVLLFFRSADW